MLPLQPASTTSFHDDDANSTPPTTNKLHNGAAVHHSHTAILPAFNAAIRICRDCQLAKAGQILATRGNLIITTHNDACQHTYIFIFTWGKTTGRIEILRASNEQFEEWAARKY